MRKFIWLLLLVSNSAWSMAPQWSFRVLRSPHFEFIYREDQKALAKRYILAAEQAHELLLPIFKEAPSKTIVLLSDNTDSANGLATFLPYPHIVIFPVLPSTLDSIDEYGDWALELMIHEYAHILNMYPAHGFYTPLKWIFGSVVRPNGILPRWYLEGLAVNLETRLSHFGRLRARETDAAARALVQGNLFEQEDIATINQSVAQRWPFGSRPYLFGGWWWDEVERTKGRDAIYIWNQNFSRRLPFFLNGPMREQTGKSANEILDSAAQRIVKQAQEQIQTLESGGPHKSERVATEDGEQRVFAISPSGKKMIYWQSSTLESGSFVKLKVREGNEKWADLKSKNLFKTVGTLRATWLNEDEFVFDQIDGYHPYHSYRDIYSYKLSSEELSRLTKNARAQEPTTSPSGKRIAFVESEGGRNKLVLLNTGNNQKRTLIKGNYYQRLSSPEFLNEDELLVVVRQRTGQERVHVVSVKGGKAPVWNEKLVSVQQLRRTSAGVLLTDQHTGVRNAYLATAKDFTAVTNSITAVQTADFDPLTNSVLVSELTPKGYRIHSTPRATYQPSHISGLKFDPPPKITTKKVAIQEESYQPIYYLWPRYLIPFVYQVEDGFAIQGMTSNQDPAGRNSYALLGSYDTITKKASYDVSYLNRSLPTQIGLSYGRLNTFLAASNILVESQYAGIALINYWPFNSRHTQWSLGGVWSHTEGRQDYKRLGPSANLRYSNLGSPYKERWSWLFDLGHQQYMEQKGYMNYGRSSAQLATHWQRSGHRISLHTRGAVSPQLSIQNIDDLGDVNVGGNYMVNLANSPFLLRGYPTGVLFGRRVFNANLEYAFPIKEIDRGFGTFPVFLRDLELVLFGDTMAVDGVGLDTTLNQYFRSQMREFYTGAGVEFRLNTNTAYHLPVSFILGLYYGFDDKIGGGFTPFLGFGLGSIGGIENKTP